MNPWVLSSQTLVLKDLRLVLDNAATQVLEGLQNGMSISWAEPRLGYDPEVLQHCLSDALNELDTSHDNKFLVKSALLQLV